MHGTVIIPNPSKMTLTIGDMVQDLFVDGNKIGNTTIKGVVLKPGDNSFPVTSITNQTAVIGLIGPGHKYANGTLNIEARTSEITYNGEKLDYYTEAMKASPVTFQLDISDALRRLGLGMVLDGPKPLSSSVSSTTSLPTSSPNDS